VTKRNPDEEDGRLTITHVGAKVDRQPEVRSIELTIEAGPAKGQTLTTASERCEIGSHPRCHIVIDDPTVSRFHCEILIDETIARVVDTGSRNGTLLDGVGVRDAYLRDGSRIQLGSTAIRVKYGKKSAPLKLSENREFGLMVGESVSMRATFSLLERASRSDATILIEGETGTGKTIAARSVHENSERKDGPFVILDCGAIPANLLESELFGHEKGSFTGAENKRIGALEEAHGGTLFLDEIGELPLELQPKLLGSIEGRWVRRVGSSKTTDVDVRIVAATNRNLREEVNAGRFRSDLYYRLAVISIRIPPLRERRADMVVLARRMLQHLGADEERIDTMMNDELRAKLMATAWPGNVRELRNYLERCLVFEEIVALPHQETTEQTPDYSALPYADARDNALRDFEHSYLRTLLEKHDRVSAAAQHAGIDRTYFYRLLRRHGLKK